MQSENFPPKEKNNVGAKDECIWTKVANLVAVDAKGLAVCLVGDDDVGPRHEFGEHNFGPGSRQVKGERALVAVDGHISATAFYRA